MRDTAKTDPNDRRAILLLQIAMTVRPARQGRQRIARLLIRKRWPFGANVLLVMQFA
jgi:hypothetical protein